MGNVRMRAEQINYGASNVKVALDDLDPKDLIALSERMDAIEAWKATVKAEEKTGAEVTFTNALALAAVSLSAEIEAEQDLHGYDKPWAGGAGKNKLPIGDLPSSIFGMPITQNADGSITIKGTSNNSGSFYLYNDSDNPIVVTDTMILTMGVNTGGAYDIYLVASQSTSAIRYVSGEVSVPAATYTGWRIYFASNTSYDFTIYPMLRASGASNTFEPWSNICPISGRTSVTITDVDAESQTATVTVQLGQTVYGGTLNVTTGVMTVTHANIASYNGETIGEPWISSMDEYTEGGTPTTGAQAVYPLATPTTTTLTPEQLTMLKGYNRLSSDGGGDITVKAYTGAPWGGDEA